MQNTRHSSIRKRESEPFPPELHRKLLDHAMPGWREARAVGADGNNRRVSNPMRDDRHPSLDIHEETGQCVDRGLGQDAKVTPYDIAAHVLGESRAKKIVEDFFEDARPNSSRPRRKWTLEPLGIPLTPAQIRALKDDGRIIDGSTLDPLGVQQVRLTYDDGQVRDVVGIPSLNAATWKRWDIYTGGGIGRDDDGKLRRYNSPRGPSSLIVSPSLKRPDPSKHCHIWDVAGESDLIYALEAGAELEFEHAFTSTTGEGSLAGHEAHKEFLASLEPHEVIVVRDLDAAGEKGAVLAAQWWRRLGFPVRIFRIPERLGPKSDLRDMLREVLN